MIPPPINRSNQCKWTFDRFNKKILPAILLAALSQISSAEGFTYHNTDTATDRSELINVPSSGSQEYDFIDIEHTPPIKNSQSRLQLKATPSFTFQEKLQSH